MTGVRERLPEPRRHLGLAFGGERARHEDRPLLGRWQLELERCAQAVVGFELRAAYVAPPTSARVAGQRNAREDREPQQATELTRPVEAPHEVLPGERCEHGQERGGEEGEEGIANRARRV